MEIKKVVVIGSGTMGSGIAAHLCNANKDLTKPHIHYFSYTIKVWPVSCLARKL